MNREALIKYIETMPSFKGAITGEGKSKEITNEHGDKTFTATLRLIKGNTIVYVPIEYVVLNEGTKDEEAYFLNREPKV